MKNVIIVVLAIIVAISAIAVVVSVNVLKGIEYKTIETANGETVVLVRPIIISEDGKAVFYKPIDEELEVQFTYDYAAEVSISWN